jgi:GcrA cell cycle regulator
LQPLGRRILCSKTQEVIVTNDDGSFWNEMTIAKLRGLWSEGHSASEIGRRMGVSKNAIIGKAHRLKLPLRPSPIRRVADDAPPPPKRPPPSLSELMAEAEMCNVMQSVTGMTRIACGATEQSQHKRNLTGRPAPSVIRRADKPKLLRPALPYFRRRGNAIDEFGRTGGRGTCVWPIGNPRTPEFRFCGDASLTAKPYCEMHAQIAYVRPRRRDERDAETAVCP